MSAFNPISISSLYLKRILGCSLFAAAIVFLLPACGGGGGSSNGNGNGSGGARNVTGIWTGSLTPSSGSAGTLELDYVQTGTAVTGTAQVIVGGQSGVGTLTGTVTGTAVNATIDFGANGITTVQLTVNGNSITGTFSHNKNGVISTGAYSLTFRSGLVTPSIAGNYTGTDTSNGGAPSPVSFTVTQTGDMTTISGTSGTGAGASAFNGTGGIIGNHLTFIVTDAGGSTTYIDGTKSGGSLSGTGLSPGTNPGNNGVSVTSTFAVSLVQAR